MRILLLLFLALGLLTAGCCCLTSGGYDDEYYADEDYEYSNGNANLELSSYYAETL
ncbi:hypothetical protein KKF81_07080 [Candidatus Micrarchaeota archaeon]|nr:hypothetical protein [Candidatus Micrarchaeota archaeon]MBU1166694.1 hypothetical protein [Candidatus Micrarchaeota archaeon]MBU1886119.1 hypothetical protein [Candidatus Micrarchaeota archaeon]